MIRRHPRSTRTTTPFPHTTLFRSLPRRAGKITEQCIGQTADLVGGRGVAFRPPDRTAFPDHGFVRRPLPLHGKGGDGDVARLALAQAKAGAKAEDRKSTRLNSSH